MIASVAILFDLAFLTIFALDDYRHLLPILPLIAILATNGIRAIGKTLPTRLTILAVALTSTIPFAWVAQQRIFGPPIDFLNLLLFDQWDALSLDAIFNIASLLIALSLLVWALIVHREGDDGKPMPSAIDTIARASSWEAGARALTTPSGRAILVGALALIGLVVFFTTGFAWTMLLAPALALFLARHARSGRSFSPGLLAAPSAVALLLLGWFEPVIAAGVSPGFEAQRGSVESHEASGYLPALRWAMRDPAVRNALTYDSYGVIWYSLGYVRRIDLIDATDIAALEPRMQGFDMDRIREFGADVAITPSFDSPSYAYFERLDRVYGSPVIPEIDDPLQGYKVTDFGNEEEWTVTRLFSPSHGLGNARARVDALAGEHTFPVSNGSVDVPQQVAVSAIQISLGSQTGSAPVSIEALGYWTNDLGLKLPYYYRAAGTSKNGVTQISTDALLRAARALGLQSSPLVLRSIAISPLHSAKWNAGFRSEGIVLGTDRTLHGLPFIAPGGQSVIDRIDASGHFGNVVLWPVRTVVDETRTRSALALSLHPTLACKAGSAVAITVSGDTSTTTSIARIPSPPEPTSKVDVPLLGDWDFVTISSITLTGLGQGCPIQERLSAKGLKISQTAVSTVNNWTDELHIVSIQPKP
jgi:hypothetical protein